MGWLKSLSMNLMNSFRNVRTSPAGTKIRVAPRDAFQSYVGPHFSQGHRSPNLVLDGQRASLGCGLFSVCLARCFDGVPALHSLSTSSLACAKFASITQW